MQPVPSILKTCVIVIRQGWAKERQRIVEPQFANIRVHHTTHFILNCYYKTKLILLYARVHQVCGENLGAAKYDRTTMM